MPFKFKNKEDIRRYVACVQVNMHMPAEIDINGINIRVTYDAIDASGVQARVEEYCVPHDLMGNIQYREQ